MALYSKRIGSRTLMISDHPDNPNLCYKWSKGGGRSTSTKGGPERYVCAGCRKMKDAKQVEKGRKLPARILINDTWVDDGPTYQHFCEPLEKNKILGLEERRKIQAELAQGSRENVASASVRIDVRVVQKYGQKNEEDRNVIRNSACGNSKATKQALRRAQVKRFVNVGTLQGLQEENCRFRWMTMRGKTAANGDDHFEELMLRHIDDDMAIFSSPRQLSLLNKSATIISDGTFKMAPTNIYQVYRVFGFVGGTHAVPLVTALMRGKSGALYERFWATLREELNQTPGELQMQQANFDFEPASVNAFKNHFAAAAKMCLFHVKQAINRRIQTMGYSELYRSPEPDGMAFQRLIRRIGALQFMPPNYTNRSIQLIRRLINESELEIGVRVALIQILDYYIDTWVQNSIGPEFFSLFDVHRHRTINHAESYHGRQRWFYQPHLQIGRWIINFQAFKMPSIKKEVSHAEEEAAIAIDEGRQQPNQPLAITAEIDLAIDLERADILQFLATDYDEQQFLDAMSRYFGRIGHLIGFNPPQQAEVVEIMAENEAEEEANASLDDNGILIDDVEEENEQNDENIVPI